MATDVLFLVQNLDSGGSQRQLVALARGLAARGYQVTVAPFYRGGILEPLLVENGVRVVALEKRGRWDIVGFIARAVKLVRAESPRVLHGYLDVPNLLALALAWASPRARIVWGVRVSFMDWARFDRLTHLAFRLACRLSCRTDLVIVNSEAGRRHHAALGYPVDRMVVIPNGIDTETFRPDTDGRARVRAEWGVAPSETLVGLVARIDPQKGHDTFLRAAAQLSQEGMRFVCVGSGSATLNAELRALAASLGLAGHVLWIPTRADVPAVYNALDVSVSTSVGEGFSNVIGEALACGVPCVVTAVGDSAEIVGDPSCVAQVGDAHGLAAMIRRETAKASTGRASALRARITTRYSEEQLVVRTIAALGLQRPTCPAAVVGSSALGAVRERISGADASGGDEMNVASASMRHASSQASGPYPADRIVFLTQDLQTGGAQRQLVILAAGLARRGHEVTVVSLYSATGPLASQLRAAGVALVTLGKRGRWDLLGVLLRLRHEISRLRPDIIHGYLDVPNLLALALRQSGSGSRVVWGVRASNMHWARYDWLTRTCFAWGCRLAHRADLIIVNSEAGRDYHLARGYPEARMYVVPNGIESDYFRPDPEMRAEMRASWVISVDVLLIGLVGRLDGMKDHATFLRAAALVAARRSDVQFVCVGSGDEKYLAKLQELTSHLGLGSRVRWMPARSDMSAVYNALDLLVSSSSEGEGFSNVVGEAMACGVPCVVTDVGDSARLVGSFGSVVPPSDPAALGAAIGSALEQLGPARRAEVRERIVREFAVARMVSRTADVLTSERCESGQRP